MSGTPVDLRIVGLHTYWAVVLFTSPWGMDGLDVGSMMSLLGHWVSSALVIVALFASQRRDQGLWEVWFSGATLGTLGSLGLALMFSAPLFGLLTLPAIVPAGWITRNRFAARTSDWETRFIEGQRTRSVLGSKNTENAVFDESVVPTDRDAKRGNDSRERYPATKAELKAKLKRQDEDPWAN